MFEVEVRDVNIPIVSFLKTLDEKILDFLKHVGEFILDLFNTAKWSWIHWFLFIVFIIILAILLINSLADIINGFWIYKGSIFFFLIYILIFILFIIIIIIYSNNITIKSEYDIIDKTLYYINIFIGLLIFGFIFSIILGPYGLGKITNPIIYLKDCITIIFIISFIIFFYNMIILILLE